MSQERQTILTLQPTIPNIMTRQASTGKDTETRQNPTGTNTKATLSLRDIELAKMLPKSAKGSEKQKLL